MIIEYYLLIPSQPGINKFVDQDVDNPVNTTRKS